MNAAARILNKSHVSRTWVISYILAKTQLNLILLIAAVLISAIGTVYTTNSARGFNADLQQLKMEQDQLQLQWGQLLLEKSTWTMPARVQKIATHELGMVIPNSQSVVIVNE
jgi:cell division protein FtsL